MIQRKLQWLLHNRRRGLWPLIVIGLIAALLLGLTLQEPKEYPFQDRLIGLRTAPALGQPNGHGNDSQELNSLYGDGAMEVLTPPGQGVERVKVGILVNNNNSLDMNQPGYISEGYYWLEWSPSLQKKLNDLNVNANALVFFSNHLEPWDSAITPLANEPLRLANGDYYQAFNFSSKLYIDNLGLQRYPFQHLNLPIIVEPNDARDDLNFSRLRLVPDIKNSGIGRYATINGFVTKDWRMAEFRRIHDTDWSHADHAKPINDDDTATTSYSAIVFDVEYLRSIRSAFWELFQPLIVVLAIVILSPSLSSALWDSRISIPTTAVLTLVFMQSGYKENLPDLPYLTFLDKIYVLAYAICLACFAMYVWAANRLNQTPGLDQEERRQQIMATIDTVDKRFQLACLTALAVGAVVAWYS